MSSSKNSDLLGLLIIIVLTAILYWQFFLLGKIPMPGDTLIGAYFPWLDYKWGFPVGVPVKNALISDVFSQFFIWKYLIVDIFKTGQIPLWNIYSLSGTPLLATYHSAVFNPFNLLLFLPKFYGWAFFISLQTLLAMLGMFLFLTLYVKNFWSRIFGAIVFSLSGLMTTWTEFGTGVYAASMLPWIFLFLEKYFNSKKLRFLFLMSISFIVLFLSGHAQLTLYSAILVFIYLAVKFVKEKNKQILFPAVFIILSGLFCSFQFLPTYEFTKESIRANEAYSTSFNYGLNPLYEVVKFFSADFFGNPATANYWDTQSYHEQSIFLGTIPFILILSFLIYKIRKKEFDFWMGVFITSIILGFENPVTKILYSLPLPFITYSSAARIFFLTSFSGGILAALALEKLSTDEKFGITFRKTNFYFLGSLIGILLGFLALIYIYTNFPDYQILTKELTNYKITVKNLSLSIAIAFSALTIFLISKFKPKFKNLLIIIFLIVTFIDLSRYFYKYNPFISQDLVFPTTPAIEFLQKQPGLFRIGRLDREVMPPNTWSFYKLQSIEGYDPLLSENYGRLFNLVNNLPYQNTLSRYRELENFNPKFINALNVKYFLSLKRDTKNNLKGDLPNPRIKELGYKTIFEDQNTIISENPNFLERAYFASKLQSLENKQALISIISSKDFDPGKEALILEKLNILEVTGQGNVEITNYTGGKIEFKTQTKNDEFLIFADTFNNGWKLFRNGIPDKIYETNVSLRGIHVPSGQNYYVMQYFPDSFKYGLWLSLAALSAYLLIFFYSLWKKKI